MSAPALVVKFGGSFAAAATRGGWLRAIAAAGGRAVLVPGGGPFADAVRAQQAPMRYSDGAAHRMALLAMAQYAEALADAQPGLVVADSLRALRAALRAGAVPVWSPWPMLRRAAAIEESWAVTSDSLAVWLATRLAAPRLLLVKQAQAGADLLDAAFPRYAAAYAGTMFLAGPGAAPARLDPAAPPGRLLPRAAA